MTNEEARAILEEVKTIDDSMYQYNSAYLEALDTAIAALKAEPCGDAVKREAVLNTLDTMDAALDENRTVEAYKGLLKECFKELPPVTPKPRTGKWIRHTRVENVYDIAGVKTWGIKHQCDQCTFTTIAIEGFGYYDYCPHCGAKMKGVSE